MSLSFKRMRWAVVPLLMAAAAVYSALVFTPALQPYAYVGPLAISGFDVSRGDQKAFQTWFDPAAWRGDVAAYTIDSTGHVDEATRLWLASERLALQNFDSGRRIVTRNGATNVALRWANLSASQQAALGDATRGPKVVDFIRGDRSNEKQYRELNGDGTVTVLSGSATGIFRARGSVLGDIIRAKAVHVGAPGAGYLYDAYPSFKSANSGRSGVVYVGANDGMLHAFDAATGNEVFAYVPSMLVGNLARLTADPYVHTYFVDGGLAVADVTTAANTWRTVLVGSLGAGGKGLFALDVTDAAAADEDAAKRKILWEITEATAGFADIGNVYGDAQIARLATGKWAALVGNGYNGSGAGHAMLYVIDIATGALIKTIDTGSGSAASPNGLSAPRAVDTDGDGKTDYVYAGDIDGNVWKFDLRDATGAAWSSSLLFKAPRPVIGAPDITAHPLGGYLVHFATGSLFTATDAADKTAQNYAYGIWDGAPAANKTLLDQTVTEAKYGTDKRVRVSTALAVNWTDASDPNGKPLHKGWRTALPPGDQVVGSGFVRDGRYHFTSINATIENPSPPDGENWLMELDYLTGATAGKPIFDLSEDGQLTDDDRIRNLSGAIVGTGSGVPVGVFLGAGLYSQPVMALLGPSFATTLFNRNPWLSPDEKPDDPPPPVITGGDGVANGHFDLDGYHSAFASSFKHVHEYDDKYNVVGANFLNASDPIFNLANNSVAGNRVTASSQFFVLVSNGDLSPGVTLTVGGTDYKAYQYPNKFDGTQPVYTAATVGLFQFRMPQNAFDSKDWGTGIVRPGLMPTATGCVKNYPYTPGAQGEVHNGALTIWIVKADAPASVIALNVPGKPEKGYKVTNDTYVLKKYTVFWHNGQCYGQQGWVINPPSNYTPNNGQHVTPAAGSQDPTVRTPIPTYTPQATVVSATTTFAPSAAYNGGNNKSGTRTTVTIYSDGSVMIFTEVLDRKGRTVSSTTTKTTGGTTPPSTPGTVTAIPKPVQTPADTGPTQDRTGPRVGRIAWHELIRE